MKDYLSTENARNKRNAGMYERLMKQALRSMGYANAVSVLCGHHLTFELDGDLSTENEIPSADCLLFDHDFMKAVFGDEAIEVMVMLATQPVDDGSRDAMLVRYLARQEAGVTCAGKEKVKVDDGGPYNGLEEAHA